MNRLSTIKQVQVVAALVEKNSINSTSRMTGVAKHTILDLLEALGCACAEYHNRAVALHFMYYNFCRIHKTMRVTPAMEAGLADHQWAIADLFALAPPKEAVSRATATEKMMVIRAFATKEGEVKK